jgi:lysophospholipase L1-like esterase
MQKRTVILKLLVPLMALLVPAVLAELVLRLGAHAAKPWTASDQVQLLKEAERRYPPSDPLYAKTCKDRPRLQHKNYDVLATRMREYPYPLARAAGSYRILGLGDSFAWGWGVADNRRTFFKLLECWLQSSVPQGAIEVINASQPGASAADYQRFMEEHGYGLAPDMVILSFNLNDAFVQHASMTIDDRTAKRLEQKEGFWSRHSCLVRFFQERIVRTRVRREFIANVHDAYFLVHEQAQRWQRAQATLQAIAVGCRQRGIALQVVIFPLLADLERRYPFAREVAEIARFCRQNGIACIDLLPVFLGKKSALLWTRPNNAHPNEVAHRLAAEAIFAFLSRSGEGPLFQGR